jgi:NADH:ubiquinone reductase (H+-translocating)
MIIPIMANKKQHRRRVVVVGGGFGGVRAAARLSKHRELAVTLISNHHTFAYYPQFYHSATGGARSEVALPLDEVMDGHDVTRITDTIATIDSAAKTVTGASGTAYSYDTLVLALGTVTNYFGIKGLQEFSFDIKTIDGAERFKRHLHREILDTHSPERNYVIVGGGPTGVELAGALGHYLRRISRLHHLTPPKYSIKLVEAAPRLLPRSSEPVAVRVTHQLRKLGVTVLTGAVVEAETAETLKLHGKTISTSTVVWTAGATNNPFYGANAAVFKLGKGGRVEVDGHLEARPGVYVIGDNAITPYAGLAQTAIHNADYVAADIWRRHRRAARPAYRPFPPANVIPVGRHWAVAQWGPITVYGYLGYMVRRVADLIGYADIERWPAAVRVWLQDNKHDSGCPICS